MTQSYMYPLQAILEMMWQQHITPPSLTHIIISHMTVTTKAKIPTQMEYLFRPAGLQIRTCPYLTLVHRADT
jgi:hypothetical protein